jgi:hypothetical protein
MLSRFLTFGVFGAASLWSLAAQAGSLALTPATGDAVQHFPAAKLRAYGTLTGEQKTVAGSPQSSVLLISCDNEDKAKLVLAKYLSDFGLLPGVTALPLTTNRGAVAAHQVDKQGAVAAVRCGSQVYIFTAVDGPALQVLVNANVPAGTKIDATEAEIPVPMYVDRWDKYGFRFYYGPFSKPHDAQYRDLPGNYDPRQDFVFADKNEKTGLVVWNSPMSAFSADGINDINSREWVYKAAQPLKLPLGINIGITDQNMVLPMRFPDGVAPAGGPYLGGWYYESFAGIPTMSWASKEAQETSLSWLKNLVTELNGKYDNIVNWLEPHEETSHGIADLLDDHGADAQKSFYDFLKTKYGSTAAVSKRYGASYASWTDVPFPELATFFGFQGDAINLAGMWKASTTAPYDASSAKPELDDSSWPNEPAPEHAIVRVLPKVPTTLRRHVTIDPAWKTAHPKAFLYVWDLENTSDTQVYVYVNGQLCPENPPMKRGWHFSQVDVSPALKAGDNLITLQLPVGVITYRSYITGEAPAVYPALATPEMNARFADFSDWCSWSRGQAVRRGMQMIRQVDPDKPITVMSPGYWWNDYKDSMEDYGGILHDTGGMAGFWNDINPATAQSTGLPTDCEPGGPAPTLDDFKKYMGRWSTENTQGVDYFGHLGDVLWNPAIKDYFEKTQPLWHIMGKYHLPQPEVADLASVRTERLFSFPFNLGDHGSSSPNLIASGPGVFASGMDGALFTTYSRGCVIEGDFKRGTADQYKVVVDLNSSILDSDTVDAIGEWVKRGGTFVTFQQTGRHTSTHHDVWPISKLTGYNVLSVDHANRGMTLAPGQTVLNPNALVGFDHNWGLSMQKADPKCQDVVMWDNGTVAAGLRRIGKGMVLDFGMWDSTSLIVKALDKMGIKHVPGELTNGKIIMHSFVSNNGLYDVWTMWNQENSPQTTDLVFHDGLTPLDCHDLNTGDGLPVASGPDGAKVTGLAFEPLQTRVFLTARNKIADAPAEWFRVQRGWWKGTANPGKPMAAYKPETALDLSNDNAFKVIPASFTGNPPEDPSLSDPKLDDSSWPKMPLGIFDIPDNVDAHHVVFRKKFTVPATWNHGQVFVFGKSEPPGNGNLRRYMDGKPFGGQIVIDDLGGVLKAGTTHVLTTEIWGTEPPLGTTSPAWITYRPDPIDTIALNAWTYAKDYLTYSGAPIPVPAVAPDTGSMRCEVDIDPKEKGRNVVVHVICDNAGINGIIFNGNFYSTYGPNIWNFMDINVTPFAKFGQKNEVIVLFRGKTTIQKASVDFYDKNVYP